MSNRITVYCTECNKQIPDRVIAARHIPADRMSRPMFCDKSCKAVWERRTGHFSRMAQARGDEWRDKLVSSNKNNPRLLIHRKREKEE